MEFLRSSLRRHFAGKPCSDCVTKCLLFSPDMYVSTVYVIDIYSLKYNLHYQKYSLLRIQFTEWLLTVFGKRRVKHTIGHFTFFFLLCSRCSRLCIETLVEATLFLYIPSFLLRANQSCYFYANKLINRTVYIRKTERFVTKQDHLQPRFFSKIWALSTQLKIVRRLS